jgi:thiamine transport system ATP-binding protein
MILIENAIFKKKKFSLSIDLHVKPQTFAAVLGGSGAGKSTLLSIIAGFEDLESGKLWLDGADMQNIPPAKRPVSMIFQDHNVFAHLNVWDNVALGIAPSLKLNAEEMAQVDAALERVGLSQYAKRKPGNISGGERQRVALARVLVRKRKILLLDEPFAALDPGLRHDMLDLVSDLRREHGLTVLMVTHQPEEALRAANEIIFVADGKVREPIVSKTFFKMHDDGAIDAYLGKTR